MAVSPFDGVNRIRFKGSPNIADCRLPIEIQLLKSAIANVQTLSPDLRRSGLPRNFYLVFNLSKGF
jgi:hypothetical protein